MVYRRRGKALLELMRHGWRRSFRRTLALVPFTVRGSARAGRWQDSILEKRASACANKTVSCEPLNPLATYFDSVKEGRGIWKWKHYLDIYHRHFQKFVGKEVHVVEVGIYSGGSLGMWKAYFGPQCRVYGVDIEPACKSYEDERTKVFIGDQADRNFWRQFREQVPRVDIVIDDGGHRPEQQIVTLEETLPHLRGGGVYICEDIHSERNQFAAYLYGLTDALNAFALQAETHGEVTPTNFQKCVCSVHFYPYIAVIEKAGSPVDLFVAPKKGTEWQPFL